MFFYLLVVYKTTNDCSVSVVLVGESTVEIKTEADINDITETANPLHDTPGASMFGFYDAILLNIHVSQLSVYVFQVLVPQLNRMFSPDTS